MRNGAPVHDERGMSLIEVLIASILTLVILIMGYQILSSTSSAATAVGNRAVNSTTARLVIDALEANLRFADAVWVCAPAVTGTPCPSPTSALTTTLTVENASGSSNTSQPACAHWTLMAGVITETVSGTARATTPGVSAATSTTGFSQPLTRLIQVDLAVNRETVNVKAGDIVTLHELIAPDNLSTTQAAPAPTPCT